MYEPREIIFAPTGRCNLACAHCRVRRDRGELAAGPAVDFLRDCAGKGVERVGFSGGEPFLRPDFLVEVVRAAVDEDFLFDRLMTNGVWFRDEAGLREVLGAVHEAGFDGTIGLSVDAWHGQDPARLALFLESVFDIWGRRDGVEIASVGARPASRRGGDGAAEGAAETGAEDATLALLRGLAERLGGELVLEAGAPVAILDRLALDEGPAGEEARAGGEALRLPVTWLSWSGAGGEGSWDDPSWFEDDRCEGPGQVLYVHPDGVVAVCCGFANERPELALGTIAEGYDRLMEAARADPRIQSRYGEGLSALRARLAASGLAFPGISADQCLFCDWLCRSGAEAAGKGPAARERRDG